jgi:hypothetical protein
MGSGGMSIILLSASGRESFEGDGCGVLKIAASSGSSPVGEMAFGVVSCGGVELPTVSLSLAVATRSEPVGGSTDLRDVSVVAWGADIGEAVDFSKAELLAAHGNATDALLVTPLMDSLGVGPLSIAICVVPITFFTEDVG